MRHFISVHIFSFIYHIYFLLHKISTVFSYQNFYIPCIFDILYRLKILISIFLLFFIKGSDTQYPTRDKFCEYFKGIGIRDCLQVFIRVEGGGRLQNVGMRRWMSPRAFQVARVWFEILTLALFHGDPIVLLCGRRNSVSRIGTVPSARCSLDTSPPPSAGKNIVEYSRIQAGRSIGLDRFLFTNHRWRTNLRSIYELLMYTNEKNYYFFF